MLGILVHAGFVIIRLFYLIVVKVVKKYVRRPRNPASSYILGDDVIRINGYNCVQPKCLFAEIFFFFSSEDIHISYFIFSLLSTAGRFLLMIKANWRRQTYQIC